MPNAGAIGNFTGIGLGALEQADPAAPVGAMLEVLACDDVQPIVPLRSATTLLATPALISDWVPMIDRVRPAQLTMMVVAGSGAMLPARSTSSAPGTLTEPGMFMVAYSSNRRTSSTAILALLAISLGDFVRGQRGRVPAGLDQFAKGLGIGIHVLE